jgi:hypothetical protein
MELTKEDVNRIQSRGHSGFYRMENGYRIMKNVKGRCFFLKNGLCSIYDIKPKGCMLYPLVMSLPSRTPAMDLDCPHRHMFGFIKDEIRELEELINTLEEERG